MVPGRRRGGGRPSRPACSGDVASGGTSGNAWSYYGQQEQSNNGAILAAPQGLGNGWAHAGGEDITFVDDMIRRIEGGLCVNPAQRFATGFSWGGGMSYALACSRTHITTTYSGCRAGCPVQWAAFDGGHIPGPVDGSSGESGVTTWTKAEIWRFFAQFQ
ncbi:hypothetical protein [Streptomyces hawaiiensis]|uniref:hypothetical protein n=1 Tax=Streptomyces hawaiiensis TaxID=67305 RepID=UPI00366836B8